jgi:hypothetical protein
VQIENLADAIAQGALRASPSIAAKLREAEEELAGLEAQGRQPTADVERLIPRLTEEIERAVRASCRRRWRPGTWTSRGRS